MYSFKTNSKSKLIVNKSKFFSFSFFINDVNDVKEILKQMHNEYPDASHICYAYILDDSANNYYYSDDGEPNKTAGFPIYNLMKKNQLFYSLIVVVRYFGGIKLGTTNLKNAFLSVASDLIKTENLCEIKQTFLCKPLLFFACKYVILFEVRKHEKITFCLWRYGIIKIC